MSAAAEKLYCLEELSDSGFGSVDTLRRYIAEGKLAAYKFGRSYRISRSDLDAFLHANKVFAPGLYDDLVAEVVAHAPEFTPEQRRRIAAVVTAGVVAA